MLTRNSRIWPVLEIQNQYVVEAPEYRIMLGLAAPYILGTDQREMRQVNTNSLSAEL